MTESGESLPANPAFSDDALRENLYLFFPNTSSDESVHTANTSPDRKRSRLGMLAAIGGSAIVGLGVWASLDLTKSSADRHSPTTELSINLGSLPKLLPKVVRADIKAVGRVDDETYKSKTLAATSSDFKTDSSGSGVEIKPDVFLTAGHVIGSTNDQINSPTECLKVTFTANFIVRDFLVNEYGTTTAKPEPGIPDLEILTLPQSSSNETTDKTAPRLTIAPKPPEIGEDLFFVNYEPDIKGGPNSNYWNSQAIYGGVYEGKTSYGDYDVITDLKSYGEISNTSSIGGASGGAVFNIEGQLVGISIRASIDSANSEIASSSSVSQYGQEDEVKFKGLRPSNQITDSIVQPVTNALINQYATKERAIPQNCFSRGGQQ